MKLTRLFSRCGSRTRRRCAMRIVVTLGSIALALAVSAQSGSAQSAMRLASVHGVDRETTILDLPANLVLDGVPRLNALTRLSESSGVGLAFSTTLLRN